MSTVGCRSAKERLLPLASRTTPEVHDNDPQESAQAREVWNERSEEPREAIIASFPAPIETEIVQASGSLQSTLAGELPLHPAELTTQTTELLPTPPHQEPQQLGRSVEEKELLPTKHPIAITLSDVVTAVYASYPSLDAVSRERQIAAAKRLAAMGQFDVNLVGDAISQPMGYYKNYRYNVGLSQYDWGGGQTFAGYRLGRGFFEPWYKERQTNDGGEFSAGYSLPFLRDRAVDERRAAVFQARIDQDAADPLLQAEVIDTVRAASQTYWDWLAAGQRVRIAQRVLDLAVERQTGMETRAKRGEIAEIELIDNERLIVSRQAKLIEEQLKLQQAAIELSLFLRNAVGTPLLATADQLPEDFPLLPESQDQPEEEQVVAALNRRPELRLVALEQRRQEVELRQASNLTLPELDGVLLASQDVGAPYSPLRDKSPFELEAGLTLDVPLQRRTARGKMLEAQAKLAQLGAKQRLTEQFIVAEVQSAYAAIQANLTAVDQARRNVDLARQLAEAERTKLARGISDILTVNLRETAMVEAEFLLVEAEANYFRAQAQLHAATASELSSRAALPREMP